MASPEAAGRQTLDVKLKRAAERRSELSPGRGFASPGLNAVRVFEPEGATDDYQ